MNISLIYTELVLFLLFIPVHTEGQTLEENFDIYERMNVLRAKLSEWKIEPPLFVEDTVLSFSDFEGVFEGYEITTKILSPDLMRYDVRLPLYLGVLSTKLNFHVKYDAANRPVVLDCVQLLERAEGLEMESSSRCGMGTCDGHQIPCLSDPDPFASLGTPVPSSLLP